MPKPLGAALLAVMILLFLIANRGAYEGYFSGDDLNNLSWTRHRHPASFPIAAFGFVEEATP